MADAETEAEWAKMRRVAKEKEKAAKAIEESKKDSVVLSYLDPKSAKTSGFSANRETVIRAVEKFTNYSIIFMILGITLGVIARAGGMVTSVGHLGVGGAIIAGLPQAISMICIIVGIVSAITGIISSIYTKVKYKTKMNYTILVCAITLVIFGVYEFLKTKII